MVGSRNGSFPRERWSTVVNERTGRLYCILMGGRKDAWPVNQFAATVLLNRTGQPVVIWCEFFFFSLYYVHVELIRNNIRREHEERDFFLVRCNRCNKIYWKDDRWINGLFSRSNKVISLYGHSLLWVLL